MKNKCDCYHIQTKPYIIYHPITGSPISHDIDVGVCWGTKEIEECSCCGDKMRCDFYPDVRVGAKKTVSVEEAISHYKYGISHDIFHEPVTTYAQLSVEALEKQIPKKPIHIRKVYPKHDWKLDKNGEIDMFVLSVGYCNGPMCNRCHTSVCEHCNPEWDEEECVVDEHRCPSCNEEVHYVYDTDKFCRNCGQALDWSEWQK